MLNQVNIIGNLGADPEVRDVSGNKVANLRVAVSEKWKDKSTGEKREKTEWVPVTIWGPVAGVAEQYLKKGSKVYISGKFQTRKWQDKDGNDRYTTEVVVQGYSGQMIMLDGASRSDSGYSPPPQSSGPTVGSGTQDLDDEIPF